MIAPDDQSNPPERPPRSVWPLLFVTALLLLVGVTGFGAGMLAERDLFSGGPWDRVREIGELSTDLPPDGDTAFPRLAETRRVIEDEYFYRPADADALATFTSGLEEDAVGGMASVALAATPVAGVDAYLQDLEYGAIHGLTSGLDDDYTVFLEPVEHAPIAEQMAGEYEGIGIWVEYPDGQFTVVAPIPESPAEEAGLQPGDVIEAADGVSLDGVTDEEALDLIRGPAGSSVELTIRRTGRDEAFSVKVERRAITMPSVSYALAAEDRVAVIRMTIFGDKTTDELDAALKRASTANVDGIVLDLRRNGGGWVTGARETIGRFVPSDRGPALYEDQELADTDDLESESILGGGEEAFDVPLVVLIDGGTASAAEIVAGALRDYDRAQLVGVPSFGKGLVQHVHDFEDGSSLRVTFARWLTPDKRPIPEEGLAPDIVVELPETSTSDDDPQLERAIAVVLSEAAR